jgi:hypothetical protein
VNIYINDTLSDTLVERQEIIARKYLHIIDVCYRCGVPLLTLGRNTIDVAKGAFRCPDQGIGTERRETQPVSQSNARYDRNVDRDPQVNIRGVS